MLLVPTRPSPKHRLCPRRMARFPSPTLTSSRSTRRCFRSTSASSLVEVHSTTMSSRSGFPTRSASCFVSFFCFSALCPASPLPTTPVSLSPLIPLLVSHPVLGRAAKDVGALMLPQRRLQGLRAYWVRFVKTTLREPSTAPASTAQVMGLARTRLVHDLKAPFPVAFDWPRVGALGLATLRRAF
jgi:hypothetical protein